MHAVPMSCGPMGVSPSVPPSHAADLFICSARSSSSRSLVSLACSAGWLKQSRFNELCAYECLWHYIAYALSGEHLTSWVNLQQAFKQPRKALDVLPRHPRKWHRLSQRCQQHHQDCLRFKKCWRTFCIEPRATNVCATSCAHESAT